MPCYNYGKIEDFKAHPRTEIYSSDKALGRCKAKTGSQKNKLALRNLEQEHILLINEDKEYELVPYDQIKDAANGSSDILAFIFERKDERFVVYWHTTGSGSLELELNAKDVTLEKELGDEPISFPAGDNTITIPVSGRRCCRASFPKKS